MTLIILDLGANDGCSIKKFEKILQKKSILDYKIYSFEPHPYFQQHLKKFENEKISIIPKIAYTKNGREKLYISTIGNDGSTIYNDKKTNGVDINKFVICDTIDIAEFIQSLPTNITLWVKMDIEGAEYDLIPHLYNTNNLKKVDKLFIEWHYKKIPSINIETHNNTLALIKGINTEEWDALSFRELNDKHYRDTFINNL